MNFITWNSQFIKQNKQLRRIYSPSSSVVIVTGSLSIPSPGSVKHKTVTLYSVYLSSPAITAVCWASGSNKLGGTFIITCDDVDVDDDDEDDGGTGHKKKKKIFQIKSFFIP